MTESDGTCVEKHLLIAAKKELARVSGTSNWVMLMFTQPGIGGLDADEPRFRGGDDVSEDARSCHEFAASEAFRLHAPLVADIAAISKDRSGTFGALRSIFAATVFDPDVFNPNRLLRPVMAVVTFATSLPADDIVTNTELRALAERHAEELAHSCLTMA